MFQIWRRAPHGYKNWWYSTWAKLTRLKRRNRHPPPKSDQGQTCRVKLLQGKKLNLLHQNEYHEEDRPQSTVKVEGLFPDFRLFQELCYSEFWFFNDLCKIHRNFMKMSESLTEDKDSSALRNRREPSERPIISRLIFTIRQVALTYTFSVAWPKISSSLFSMGCALARDSFSVGESLLISSKLEKKF